MRPLVVIESPLAGDFEKNVAYAKRCIHDSLGRGENPYASHLLFAQPGLLDDTNEEQRDLGIECGLGWAAASAMHAIYIDLGISDGMKKGIRSALMHKKRVEFRALDRELTPDDVVPVVALLQEFQRTIDDVLADRHATHKVKCWTGYFDAVLRGDKPFEVRRNDRNYRVGDHLVLEEWDPSTEAYTGRVFRLRITYVLAGGAFGIDRDYCVLGVQPERVS